MKNNTIKYITAAVFFGVLMACSTKKNSFVNRNYHAVTTEYNVLYNGQVAFDKGVEDLKATYKDNFWEVLPVERMQSKEEGVLPGQTKNANFERAETKAVKAIQKHSMNIDGGEKNPQMDEAHLLLGKARYHDNRFLPAQEAFNYILYKYPTSDKIFEAKVWREKTNIRLENNEQAITNLKRIIADKQLKGQVQADANAILAQAYLNTGIKDTAVQKLKIARQLTEHNEEKARYRFILGQLYESMGHKDSAFTAFQEVIDMKRKSPRRYIIWAHAKQAQQFDYKNGDTLVFTEKFADLLQDRENRPYLDVINHQMALFYDKSNMPQKAKKYYNKSLRSSSQDNYLTASNYRNLGALHFEEAKYAAAGKYYDSTLLRLNNKSREFFAIRKKRENLADVIKYENSIQVNDSILKVVAMSDNEKKNFYEAYIAKLKIADEKRALEEANRQQSQQQQMDAVGNPNVSKGAKDVKMNPSVMMPPAIEANSEQTKGGAGTQSNFYFYNTATVAFGKTEFKKKWGNRTLKENWRWASGQTKADPNEASDENPETNIVKADENPEQQSEKPQYSTAFYLDQLPTDVKVLDSLARERNFAYFQLGTIYKEKFKEYELAASRLEKLLVSQPEERMVLPAKYNLYKIYEIINTPKAAALKQAIIATYPDSRYAQILQNPNSEIAQVQDSPERVFATLYKAYEKGNYHETLLQTEALLPTFAGDVNAPKFEMLHAKIAARLKGVATYKKELEAIAYHYPNLDEGKKAEEIIKNDIPKLEQLAFGTLPPMSWKIIFPIPYPNDKDPKVKVLSDKLQQYIKERNSSLVTLSNDVYTMDKSFLVVHGLGSKEAAQSTISVLQEFKEYKIKDPAYVISNEDYKIVQIKKNLNDYLATVK